MRHLSLMLKPSSGMCNMRCKYCFYADETQKRSVPSYGFMSLETLEQVMKKALEAADGSCTICFQGGEPTLAGLDFFRRAVELGARWNVHGCAVSYALQTNGLLIDEEWCRFLAQHHFLVGVSLDGTKDLHDANRVDAQGKGTFTRVFRAIQLLRQHGVDTNVLTVLTGNLCRSFRKVYQFYDKNGLDYQQYIPCLDPLEEPRGGHPWSLTPQRLGQYLNTAFDCWYADAMAGHKKYHRFFDNLLLMLDRQPPEACGMLGVCGMQYVVEADGSVYPCDFYMLDAYRLGNLNTDSFQDLDARRTELGFVEASAQPDPACRACTWFPLCRGGCRRDRDYGPDGIGRNYYCESYRTFFPYAYPRLERLYRLLTERWTGEP